MFSLHATPMSVMNAFEPSNLCLQSLDAIPILQTPRVSFVSSIEIVMLFCHA